jgi:hypothetical protein
LRNTTITTTTPIIKTAAVLPVPAATAMTDTLSLALPEIRCHFIIYYAIILYILYNNIIYCRNVTGYGA